MDTFDGWNDELCHHGIKGQKWGIRRYQNPDGTLTAEGKLRYMQQRSNYFSVKYASYRAKAHKHSNTFGQLLIKGPEELDKYAKKIASKREKSISNADFEDYKKAEIKKAIEHMLGDFSNKQVFAYRVPNNINEWPIKKQKKVYQTAGEVLGRTLNELEYWYR